MMGSTSVLLARALANLFAGKDGDLLRPRALTTRDGRRVFRRGLGLSPKERTWREKERKLNREYLAARERVA